MSPKTITGEELELDDAPVHETELFLVDGNNLAYRAFFALPEELQTTDGQPTNALLGFTNMLFKLLSDYKPRGVAVAWDTRPGAPHRDLRRVQVRAAPDAGSPARAVPALPADRRGVRVPEPRVRGLGGGRRDRDARNARGRRPGSRRASSPPTATPSSSCSENICLMMTPRGRRGRARVHARARRGCATAIRPDQVPDFIGLKGDTSDNIPGIPGIGDKTAGQLIAQYGSLEEVVEHADELSPARSRSIKEHAEQARESKLLATMRRDLELGVDPPELVSRPPDRSQLKEIFRRFEFRGLLSRVDTLDEALPAAERPKLESQAVPWREGELPALSGQVGLAADADRVAVATGGEVVVAARPSGKLPQGAKARLAVHDAKSLRVEAADDTMIAAYLIDPGRAEYLSGDLAAEYGLELDPEPPTEEETAALVRRAEAARRLAPTPPGACPRARPRAALRRGRASRSPRCWPRWRRPASASTPTGWARSPRGCATGSRSSRRGRTSSPARSSSSARRCSSAASCSRSSS